MADEEELDPKAIIVSKLGDRQVTVMSLSEVTTCKEFMLLVQALVYKSQFSKHEIDGFIEQWADENDLARNN